MQNTPQHPKIIREIAPFKVEGRAIPYAEFIPKLYNFCLALGFRKGLIMPSRAFCSDENQGIPIMLITKHFGIFPFNHGRVGGIVAVDRHGPHAHHGEDSVIIQASHVGYNPESGIYGTCTRPKMQKEHISVSCGKITHVITPYLDQYQFAKNNIFLHLDETGNHLITIKNSLIDFASHPVKDNIVLRLEIISKISDDGRIHPVSIASTTHTYVVSDNFKKFIGSTGYSWKNGLGECIGEKLTADFFYFREDLHETDDSILLERNLLEYMSTIVTSKSPALSAAKINVQMEFARTVESIRRGTEYKGKNLLFIAGLNIDISENDDYPASTYFVPWAAHIQLANDTPSEYRYPVEQDMLYTELMKQDSENPDQVSLSDQISCMLNAPKFVIRSPE